MDSNNDTNNNVNNKNNNVNNNNGNNKNNNGNKKNNNGNKKNNNGNKKNNKVNHNKVIKPMQEHIDKLKEDKNRKELLKLSQQLVETLKSVLEELQKHDETNNNSKKNNNNKPVYTGL